MDWPLPLSASIKIIHGGNEKSASYKTFYSNVSVCALNNKYWGKRPPVVGSTCKDQVRTGGIRCFRNKNLQYRPEALFTPWGLFLFQESSFSPSELFVNTICCTLNTINPS
jgi:hypothetical protein